MNLSELTGPVFLVVYAAAVIGALIGAMLARDKIIGTGNDKAPACAEVPLESYDLALLTGGRRHAFLSAVAALAHRDALKIDEKDGKLEWLKSVEPNHELEREILSKINYTSHKLDTVLAAVQPSLVKIEDKLTRYGLVLGKARVSELRWKCFSIMMAPLVILGVPRLVFGISLNHPVAFLIAEMTINLLIAVCFAFQKDRPTPAGQRLLDRAKKENGALEMTYKTSPRSLGSADLLIAAILFGATAGSLDPFVQARKALYAKAGSCGGGSSGCGGWGIGSCGSSSGGGCGGGGCGGGGCGGGGCGGGGCGG